MNHAGGKNGVKPLVTTPPPTTGFDLGVVQIYNEYGYQLLFKDHPSPAMNGTWISEQFTVRRVGGKTITAGFFDPDPHTVTIRIYNSEDNALLAQTSNSGTGYVEAGFSYSIPHQFTYILISFF